MSHYTETSVSTSVEWRYWVKANLLNSFLALKFYGFMKRTHENVRLGFRFDFLKYDNFIIYYSEKVLSTHGVSGTSLVQ